MSFQTECTHTISAPVDIPKYPYYQERLGWSRGYLSEDRDIGLALVNMPPTHYITDKDVQDVI